MWETLGQIIRTLWSKKFTCMNHILNNEIEMPWNSTVSASNFSEVSVSQRGCQQSNLHGRRSDHVLK